METEAYIHARNYIFSKEGKSPLGKPRRKWEDDIKTDLKKME
jgi:hypothetical protein